jgi:phage regulator Rha-like protein
MNELIRKQVSMTTVEIAEQTSKRHDHVMRDAKNMLLELHGIDSLPSFGESYRAENGQEYECYRLPKREVLIRR